jgi:hypothetical protein
MALKARKKLKYFVFTSLTIGLIVLCFIFFFAPITTIYNITAQTEKVQYQTIDKNNSRFSLYNAKLINYDGEVIKEAFEGSFEINENVNISFERISNGPIIISATNNKKTSVGKFYDGYDGSLIYTANDYIDIIITQVDSILNEGTSFVFPISGLVNIGRSVDLEIFGETTPLLRNGDITMTGYSTLNGQYFEAGNEKLFLGDYLTFEEQNEKAFGFITIDENPCMQAAYRVHAKVAKIIKPGPKDVNSGYAISASLYDRFIKDRLFQGISLLFGSLLVITTIATFIMDYILFKKEIK